MPNPETRPSLIVQLRTAGNEAAWFEFVELFEPFLQRLVERRGVPPAHVADVTQQVLASIARCIEQWEDDGRDASLRRWISRVARNVVIRYMSRERRHAGGLGGSDAMDLLSELPGNETIHLANQYEHELVVWAAEQVRGEFIDTSWKAFWATMIEGRDVASVAEELSVTRGSIYMSRGRILKRIREKVDEVMQ